MGLALRGGQPVFCTRICPARVDSYALFENKHTRDSNGVQRAFITGIRCITRCGGIHAYRLFDPQNNAGVFVETGARRYAQATRPQGDSGTAHIRVGEYTCRGVHPHTRLGEYTRRNRTAVVSKNPPTMSGGAQTGARRSSSASA